MIIESLRLRNFRCFGDEAETFTFNPGLTAFVGSNGAGKTAIIAALQKLFGARAEDRRLVREDVHFGADEEPGPSAASDSSGTAGTTDPTGAVPDAGNGSSIEGGASPINASISVDGADNAQAGSNEIPASPISVTSREVELEAIIRLDELQGEPAESDAIPEVFRHMSIRSVGDVPKLRIRLEATWQYGVEEDDINSRIYWITSLEDVPFGERDIAKRPLSGGDRKRIQIRYLQATRDGNAIVRQALRELLAWLERFGDWSAGRESMAQQWKELQTLFDEMPAIGAVTQELAKTWTRLFEGPHLQSPRLTVLSREIQRALRELSLTLGPGPAGRHRSVHELSEGQSSLFYIALVITLIKLDEQLAAEKLAGFVDQPTLRPWLTIIALEEPENHLSPFYLSRMVQLMADLAEDAKVMGLLTTHSASALRRLEPGQVRHVRHDPAVRISHVRTIPLPGAGHPDALKFVQEAVTSQPELYFARLVILGEGRSEEIVLPHLARALDRQLELDPAFIAFVPLGGRHVNHFWRLLNGLQIPHLTLLDFDLGRANAGPLRLKYAVTQLGKIGVPPPSHLPLPADNDAWKGLTPEDIKLWREWLATHGVYFSAELDLDMMMLQAFPEAYGPVSGIDAAEPGATYQKSVFGEKGMGNAVYAAGTEFTPLDLARYDALFKKGSKPVAHVEALKDLSNAAVRERCPEPLQALFDACRVQLGIPDHDEFDTLLALTEGQPAPSSEVSTQLPDDLL